MEDIEGGIENEDSIEDEELTLDGQVNEALAQLMPFISDTEKKNLSLIGMRKILSMVLWMQDVSVHYGMVRIAPSNFPV